MRYISYKHEPYNQHFCFTYLVTFSRLIEHFQMAPVAAASNSLFSTLNDRDTRGSSPPYLRTRSRVSSSSAHWKQVQALLSHSSSVWCARDRYGFKSLLVTENSRLYLGLNAFSSSFLSNEKIMKQLHVH